MGAKPNHPNWGRVRAVVSPVQAFNDGTNPYQNGGFVCQNPYTDDCFENVHETQTLSLLAEANLGYRFSHWETVGNLTCPCLQQGRLCFAPYEAIGVDGLYRSEDLSECRGVFVPGKHQDQERNIQLPRPDPTPVAGTAVDMPSWW